MKNFALATLVLACFSASAQVSTGAAGGIGGSSLTSTSSASASAVGRGSASVSAFNQGYSSTGVSSTVGVSQVTTVGSPVVTVSGTRTTTAVTTTDTKSGNVGVEGYSITANMSGITTRQSGTGLALGAAGGSAVSGTVGTGTFNLGSSTAPSGNVQGLSGATTLSGVVSLGNGSNFQNGGMSTSFRGTASADLATNSVASLTTRSILGVVIPVSAGVTSNSAVQNVGTTAVADAAGNTGFSGAPVIANAGLATGVLVNAGTASTLSNATVSNVVISGVGAGSL